MQTKRALLVGIDHYRGMALKGCVADATEMAWLLHKNPDNTNNYDINLVVSGDGKSEITRSVLRGLLRKLFANSTGMDLFFFFAGHGSQSPWGAELLPQDYPRTGDGVSVNDVVTLANASAASEVVIILDSCFAGDAGNLKGFQSDELSSEFRFGKALLREGVTILSASRPTEGAAEEHGHGSFTKLLLQGLEGGAADHLGNVSALSLYEFASRAFGAFEQRPMLKSHLTRPSILRNCKSAITPEVFANILKYFPSATAKVRLCPGYEGKRPIPKGRRLSAEQEAFDYFKLLRNTGLLKTENDIDLYYAAIKSKNVYLTPTGQYLWRLAKKDSD
ncbi:MAG TPA: caspase family protein [Blastocatellia bacterium]|nr:caspase family protein [Blastocatellia bacterium]